MANPFLVLGGIAVGVVTAAFGILQVPGWVASAQDAAAINDLSNLNQAQAVHRSTSGMFADKISALSGGADAAGFGLEAPVTTLAMAAATSEDIGISFRLSDGVSLAHLGTTGAGDAYCAVVRSASGRYFASTSTKPISDASETGLAAMNSAECVTEARGDYTGLEPGAPGDGGETEEPEVPVEPEVPAGPKYTASQMVFTIDTSIAKCTNPAITFSSAKPTATIDWGDGSEKALAAANANRHTYPAAGVYEIVVDGTIPGFTLPTSGSADCFTAVKHWGADTGTKAANGIFYRMVNLTEVVQPPVSLTDYTRMFDGASSFNQNIDNWDVSHVTNMQQMFSNASSFNQSLRSWNVGNVENMKSMFSGAKKFNSDISTWNTAKVKSMESTFASTDAFNGDLSKWNTSSVTTMRAMFMNATVFNSDISKWDTSNVTLMDNMFRSARAFNQPIGDWDVRKVTTMASMFDFAVSFNQDLSKWETAAAQNMKMMFLGAASFNNDVSDWSVPAVTNWEDFNTNSALVASHMPAKFR